MNDIMVSIICNAFDHEKYIRNALDGFVMQKTDFKFEVLIHDDASKDKTADIIREYEIKYPEIIKPIYQTENQYSQGIKISRAYQYPRVKGKYVAVCEGDDYWIDPYKLQKQVDALEKHPEVDICAHCAKVVSFGKYIKSIPDVKQDTIFKIEDVIEGGGGFVGTASLVYRRELMDKKMKFHDFLQLDYTLQILGSLRGGMLYLSDEMSVYNYLTESSWSNAMIKDYQKHKIHLEKCITMLDILNEETNGKYNDPIKTHQCLMMYKITDTLEEYKVLKKEKKYYKRIPLEKRIKLFVKVRIPFLVWLKRKVRGK